MTTITTGQLIPAATINQWAPPGMVVDYAGAAAPTGWLLCNGASYLRSDYPDLFTAIGTAYGSADGTHFNVPDARGRVSVGYAASGGHVDVSTLGNNDGVAAANRRPKHQTSNNLTVSANGAAAPVGAMSSGAQSVVTGQAAIVLGGSIGTNNANDAVDAPAYLVLNKIIRAKDA